MTLATAATVFACTPILIGSIFMLKAPTAWQEAFQTLPTFQTVSQSTTDFKKVSFFLTHLFFMLGLVVFNWGITMIGTAVYTIPAQYAVAPGLTSMFITLMYMVIMKQGM